METRATIRHEHTSPPAILRAGSLACVGGLVRARLRRFREPARLSGHAALERSTRAHGSAHKQEPRTPWYRVRTSTPHEPAQHAQAHEPARVSGTSPPRTSPRTLREIWQAHPICGRAAYALANVWLSISGE